VLRAPSAPVRPRRQAQDLYGNRNIQVGMIVTATLLGWVAARRRQQARRMAL
jgi:hypothetical protein